MRIAAIADVHANLDALVATLADVDAVGVDAVWCLGDLVGYGPDPAEAVALVRERCDVVLAGNHELMATNRLGVRWDGALGRSIELAELLLDAEQLSWLRDLPTSTVGDGLALVHGSPRDPGWEFISSPQVAAACFELLPVLSLYAHTHEPRAFTRASRSEPVVRSVKGTDGAELTIGDHAQVLLNPGTVGRPQRDGDTRASWLVLDDEAGNAVWRRVAYDRDGVLARMRRLGLERLV